MKYKVGDVLKYRTSNFYDFVYDCDEIYFNKINTEGLKNLWVHNSISFKLMTNIFRELEETT